MRINCFTLFVLLFFACGCGRSESVTEVATQAGAQSSGTDVSQDADSVVPAVESIEMPPTSEDVPVVWRAVLDRDQAKPRESVQVTVVCEIHEGWHIYSVTGPTGVARPTVLDLEIPDQVGMLSEWQLPDAEVVVGFEGPEAHYSHRNAFSSTLQIADGASAQSTTLRCKIDFQACKATSCLPPDSTVIELPFVVLDAKE